MTKLKLFSLPLVVLIIIGSGLMLTDDVLWSDSTGHPASVGTLMTGSWVFPIIYGCLIATGIGLLAGMHSSRKRAWKVSVIAFLLALGGTYWFMPINLMTMFCLGFPLPNPIGIIAIIYVGLLGSQATRIPARFRLLPLLILTLIIAWVTLSLLGLRTAMVTDRLKHFSPQYELAWSKPLDVDRIFHSGIVTADNLFLTHSTGVISLDLLSGDILWSIELPEKQEKPISFCWQETCGVLRGNTALGFQKSTGAVSWRIVDLPKYAEARQFGANIVITPELSLGSSQAHYLLINITTGDVQNINLPGPEGEVPLIDEAHESILVHAGPFLLVDSAGRGLLHLNWGPKGVRPERFTCESENNPRQDYAHLYGLDKEGNLAWHISTGHWQEGSLNNMVSWDENTLAAILPDNVTGSSSELEVYNLLTGELIWQKKVDYLNLRPYRIAISDEIILVESGDIEDWYKYYNSAFDLEKGIDLWSIERVRNNTYGVFLFKAENTLVYKSDWGLKGICSADGSVIWEKTFSWTNTYQLIDNNRVGYPEILLLSGGIYPIYKQTIIIDAITGKKVRKGPSLWDVDNCFIYTNKPKETNFYSRISFLALLGRYPVAMAGGERMSPNIRLHPDSSNQLDTWNSVQELDFGKLVIVEKNRQLVISLYRPAY